MSKKMSNKFKLVIIFVWFIIFYFLMWFIGGGCTNIFSGGNCISTDAVSPLSSIPFIGLLFPFGQWVSILFFITPLVGFVLGYIGIKKYNEYFETEQAYSIIVPILLLVVLFLGYSINLAWYYGNVAQVNNSESLNVQLYFCFDEAKCYSTVDALNIELQNSPNSSGRITQLLPINYWQELKSSVFLTFIFGAIAAWVPLFVFNLIDKK